MCIYKWTFARQNLPWHTQCSLYNWIKHSPEMDKTNSFFSQFFSGMLTVDVGSSWYKVPFTHLNFLEIQRTASPKHKFAHHKSQVPDWVLDTILHWWTSLHGSRGQQSLSLPPLSSSVYPLASLQTLVSFFLKFVIIMITLQQWLNAYNLPHVLLLSYYRRFQDYIYFKKKNTEQKEILNNK